jgi:hypothetical protein
MDEREYLKILELLKEKETSDIAKEMLLQFSNTVPRHELLLIAMMVYEHEKRDIEGRVLGSLFTKWDRYQGGCLRKVSYYFTQKILVDQTRGCVDHYFHELNLNRSTPDEGRDVLLLFVRRLTAIGIPWYKSMAMI